MDSSPQSTLLKSIGAKGGIRVTGESLITGNFMAIKALEEVTILGSTACNIQNISGAVLAQGDVLLGEFTVANVSGDSVLYFS